MLLGRFHPLSESTFLNMSNKMFITGRLSFHPLSESIYLNAKIVRNYVKEQYPFPSPLGVYISNCDYKKVVHKFATKFPSPLGIYISKYKRTNETI